MKEKRVMKIEKFVWNFVGVILRKKFKLEDIFELTDWVDMMKIEIEEDK